MRARLLRVPLIGLFMALAWAAHGQTYSSVRVPYVPQADGANVQRLAFQLGQPEERRRKADAGYLNAKLSLLPGTAPTVILMHGCDGGQTGPAEAWTKAWGGFFHERGYSVMALDSFTTRRVKSTCGATDSLWSHRRRDDAYSALDYLAAMGRTDMSRVFVMGRSSGGLAVLRMLDARMSAIRPHRFAGGFAMYPACRDDIGTRFYAPLHVFVGAEDDASPADACAAMARANPAIQVTILPDAFHGFDDGSRPRVAWGVRLGGNARAVAQARRLIENDLRSLP